MRLSLCMIVRNEEKFLADCLASVAGVVDEMVIVDTGSTDRTIEIAQTAGARISLLPWPGSFAAARNHALSQCSGDWVLVMDADERLDSESVQALRDLTAQPSQGLVFYEPQIRNYFDESGEGYTRHYVTRLFPRLPNVRFHGLIHEQLICADPSLAGAVISRPDIIIHHWGYTQTAVEQANKFERNRDLLIEALQQEPDNAFHHFNLAQAYLRGAGDRDSAAYHYSLAHINALDMVPIPRFIVTALTQAMSLALEMGQIDIALKYWEEAPAICMESPEFVLVAAVALLQYGSIRGALNHFKIALEAFKRPSVNNAGSTDLNAKQAYYGMAECYRRMGQLEMAVNANRAAELVKT